MTYSALDRLVHRVVFGVPGLQFIAADVEKVLFGSQFTRIPAERPIFISSLPRAGTTMLLEALSRFSILAAHNYRDMPLVLAPLLWSRISGAFQLESHLKARAHGDGINIGFNSPEAFEEVIWRSFWPEKYVGKRIALWSASDASDEARAFFLDHMRKIVALRRPESADQRRYVSKNNANIARLDVIGEIFPDADIVVPFRDPLDQAASLLQQHRNFSRMHATDPFMRRYMADIGHYEFGSLHSPIAFPGLDTLTGGRDPFGPDYWLGYWIAAFDHVLANGHKVILVSFEALCTDAQSALGGLCDLLGIATAGPALSEAARLFRPSNANGRDLPDFDPDLCSRAKALHDSLRTAPGL